VSGIVTGTRTAGGLDVFDSTRHRVFFFFAKMHFLTAPLLDVFTSLGVTPVNLALHIFLFSLYRQLDKREVVIIGRRVTHARCGDNTQKEPLQSRN
jgi:hypothetical protein